MATVNAANQDAWFNDIIPFGNFQATLHWTDDGSTPWNMYSNMMDGAQYVPLGETATWNFGRYNNDEVTAALAEFAGASDDAARQAAIGRSSSATSRTSRPWSSGPGRPSRSTRR